jgi:hypothetical protein
MPDCGKIPTNTERIDWFLPTVTEEIYASAKAMSNSKDTGDTRMGDMVLLFNYTYFARYPHFQIAELQTGKKLSQNSVNSHTTKCALHPEGNHTTADCKKLRQLQLNPPQDKGGRGRIFKGKGRGNQRTPWQCNRNTPPTKGNKGKNGGKGKGKQQTLGFRPPKFTGTCSHCGIVGHMARDCYKRQQGIRQTVLKQHTIIIEDPPISHKKPALIEFQQFPIYVKRPLEEGDKEDMAADQHLEEKESPLSLTDLPPESSSADTDSPSFVPTWGTEPSKGQQQDSTWGEITPKTARHNSPDSKNYRSGICQFCDPPLGTNRAHGPLICRECRVLLEDDKQHEKEQQEYIDRKQAMRQANYATQLAGTTEETKELTQESQSDNETKENNRESSPEPLTTPNSPSARSDIGWGPQQNFVRITLAQLFKTDKRVRLDGKIRSQKLLTTILLTNRFTSLTEIQDEPPIPRWTRQLLQSQFLFLERRQRRKKEKMRQGQNQKSRVITSVTPDAKLLTVATTNQCTRT